MTLLFIEETHSCNKRILVTICLPSNVFYSDEVRGQFRFVLILLRPTDMV